MPGETLTAMALGAVAGVAATVTMDVLATRFQKLGLTAGARGEWVGRWYLGIARGHLVHANIATAPARAGEKRIAMVGHYAIGIVLAVLYSVGVVWLGISPDNLMAALGYGFATCVLPWFLMYPAFGFGWLGLRGPSELKLVSTSVVNHLSYGFGLWWSTKVLLSLLS